MSVNAVSVPFPPAPEIGDEYSIWKFDGLYWLLNGENAGSDVTWESITEKPGSITSLGVDNKVESTTYQSAKGIEKDKASDSWSKNK
jgi:hypothetical protein